MTKSTALLEGFAWYGAAPYRCFIELESAMRAQSQYSYWPGAVVDEEELELLGMAERLVAFSRSKKH